MMFSTVVCALTGVSSPVSIYDLHTSLIVTENRPGCKGFCAGVYGLYAKGFPAFFEKKASAKKLFPGKGHTSFANQSHSGGRNPQKAGRAAAARSAGPYFFSTKQGSGAVSAQLAKRHSSTVY